MTQLLAFAKLTRPVFLAGGAILYALGAALAAGPIDPGHYAVGQVMVTVPGVNGNHSIQSL